MIHCYQRLRISSICSFKQYSKSQNYPYIDYHNSEDFSSSRCLSVGGVLALSLPQFVIAHILSLYLLIYQHLKRLPEVCYCHHAFWILSFIFTVISYKSQADLLSQLFDMSFIFVNGILLTLIFIKQKTMTDSSISSRPLIREEYEIPQLLHLRQDNSVISDNIDVKFRSKVRSYQGQCMFEFRVYLPYQIKESYLVKKSLNDFFLLDSYMHQKHGNHIPKINKEIFRNSQTHQQTKVFNKAIKMLETYLKKLGKDRKYWDNRFLTFLDIHDNQIIQRIQGNLQFSQSQQNQETVARLYQNITFIDNYESENKELDLTPLIKSEQQEIELFEKFTIDVLSKTVNFTKVQINTNQGNWQIEKKNEDWNSVMNQYEISDIDQLCEAVQNNKASLELMQLIDYFRNTQTTPTQFIQWILSNEKYEVKSIDIVGQNIEIVDNESTQCFDIAINIRMIDYNRIEQLDIHKSFNQVKCLINYIQRQLQRDSIQFPIKRQSFAKTKEDQQKIVKMLSKVLKDERSLKLVQTIDFLSDIKIQQSREQSLHTRTTDQLQSHRMSAINEGSDGLFETQNRGNYDIEQEFDINQIEEFESPFQLNHLN